MTPKQRVQLLIDELSNSGRQEDAEALEMLLSDRTAMRKELVEFQLDKRQWSDIAVLHASTDVVEE